VDDSKGGNMAIKDQLHRILEASRAAELNFIEQLTDDDLNRASTYEEWSPKDIVAHANYWQHLRAERNIAWIQGKELEPVPQFEQGNLECYKRFSENTWDEVKAFAEQAHKMTLQAIEDIDEQALAGPSSESEEQKMWEAIVGGAYTHKLAHYAEFYTSRGKKEDAGRLWNQWAELVSPLDDGPEWQGGVHYNAACSLALAEDREGALQELKKGLTLRPGLRAWSRRDSDLAILHDTPEYRALFAAEYWWAAIDANPLAEALADQFLRTLVMLRAAIDTFPEDAWREGETLYQRPAGLALHIAQTMDFYSALKQGENSGDSLSQVNWEERDASKLPSQKELLRYLDVVEERMADFIANADLQASETLFPWTGFTTLSRALYTLRHTQHHLADMAMELQRRELRPPSWQ
jgi:hypothetical protein